MRQHDVAHSSAVNSAYPPTPPRAKTRHIVEFCLQSIGRAEQILLTPDDKDTGSQNCDRYEDKSSQPHRSRHRFSYECLRNSRTNSISLFLSSSKLPSMTTLPSLRRARRSAIVSALC